ncbi:MAG: hypothetical protein ACOZCE_09330 [Spirochaetota bacterium]|jgi:hypothetical protein
MAEGSLKVQVFLVRLKQILKTPERILFINRDKNLEAMERFGLTQRDLLRQLSVLEPKHYRKGPKTMRMDQREVSGYSIAPFIIKSFISN